MVGSVTGAIARHAVGAGDGQAFTGAALRSTEAMQIAPEVRATILSGNAQRILKIA